MLREGNSDRRAPSSVKAYARANSHRMGKWSTDSDSHVSSMTDGDSSATSSRSRSPKQAVCTSRSPTNLETIELRAGCGRSRRSGGFLLYARLYLLPESVACAKDNGVLFSLHMKATMMKVSDPIIFGHGVRAWLLRF